MGVHALIYVIYMLSELLLSYCTSLNATLACMARIMSKAMIWLGSVGCAPDPETIYVMADL